MLSNIFKKFFQFTNIYYNTEILLITILEKEGKLYAINNTYSFCNLVLDFTKSNVSKKKPSLSLKFILNHIKVSL